MKMFLLFFLLCQIPSNWALAVSRANFCSQKVRVEQDVATSVDSGALIWDAGRALSDYLLKEGGAVVGHGRILELGSGTGLVGLTAAGLGANEVFLTDKPELIALLERNIEVNDLSGTVKAIPLCWGEDDATAMGAFDLILGSDLLYAPEAFEPLLETLSQVCQPARAQIWLAYPTRFTEDIFFEQAYSQGFEELELTQEIEPGIFLSKLVRVT